jgi:methylglyoxal synthase
LFAFLIIVAILLLNSTNYMTPTSISQQLISNAELAQYFSSEEISIFCGYLQSRDIESDAILMAEGEPADCLMYLLEGKARVLSDNTQISVIDIGGCFGESMFTEQGIRTASVQAVENCTVGVFTLEDYSTFIAQNSCLAIKFKKYFVAVKARHDTQTQGLLFRDDKKYLALIAHNEMKKSLAEFVRLHVEDIGCFPLVATGTTGMMLYKETGLVLGKKVASGPLGGDQAIGTLVSTDNICGIIFFRDPLSAHPHHADIEALGRLCDVYQVPFATNPGTAEAILKYLQVGEAHVSIANQVLDNYRNGQKKVLSSP